MRGGTGVGVEGDWGGEGPGGERGSTAGVGGRRKGGDDVGPKGGGETVVEDEEEDWGGGKLDAPGVLRRARVTIGAAGGTVGRAVNEEGGMGGGPRSTVDVVGGRTRAVGAPAAAVAEEGGGRVVEEEDVDWGGRKVAALGMVRRARGATSAAGVAVGRAVDEGGSVGGWARGTVGVVGRQADGAATPAIAVAEGGGKVLVTEEEEEVEGREVVALEVMRRARVTTIAAVGAVGQEVKEAGGTGRGAGGALDVVGGMEGGSVVDVVGGRMRGATAAVTARGAGESEGGGEAMAAMEVVGKA